MIPKNKAGYFLGGGGLKGGGDSPNVSLMVFLRFPLPPPLEHPPIRTKMAALKRDHELMKMYCLSDQRYFSLLKGEDTNQYTLFHSGYSLLQAGLEMPENSETSYNASC